jgi:hypothetical protein
MGGVLLGYSQNRRVPGTRVTISSSPVTPAERHPTRLPLDRSPQSSLTRLMQLCCSPCWDTPPESGSATLTSAVLRVIAARRQGKHAADHNPSLAAAFVNPAVEWLAARSATVSLGKGHAPSPAKATEDRSIGVPVPIPSPKTKRLSCRAALGGNISPPGISAPDAFHAIVNATATTAPPLLRPCSPSRRHRTMAVCVQ